jgi:hypothetical protein
MPWPDKQRTAIFLAIKRKKGERAAIEFMHAHGYGGKKRKLSRQLQGR